MTVSTEFAFADGLMVVKRAQDCTPIAEHCTALRNETQQRGEMRLAARLPDVVVEAYINDNGITWAEFVKNPAHARAMLSDPALAAFRVWGGRV